MLHLREDGPSEYLHVVRDLVLQIISSRLTPIQQALAPMYTHKMFLKTANGPQGASQPGGGDSWALFTFAASDGGPSLDIKCVQRCARTYQFSVDSVFVRLDGLLPAILSISAEAESSPPATCAQQPHMAISPLSATNLALLTTTTSSSSSCSLPRPSSCSSQDSLGAPSLDSLPPSLTGSSLSLVSSSSASAASLSDKEEDTEDQGFDEKVFARVAEGREMEEQHASKQQSKAMDRNSDNAVLPCAAPLLSALPSKVVAGSYYGCLEEACDHLRGRIIAVADPSEMASVQGGGLLKYASLLARGFRVAAWLDSLRLERFMCARFHIDFPSHGLSRFGLPMPMQRIHDYIATHMGPYAVPARTHAFLRMLRGIVTRAWPHDPSTIVAMINAMLPLQQQSRRRAPLAPQHLQVHNLYQHNSYSLSGYHGKRGGVCVNGAGGDGTKSTEQGRRRRSSLLPLQQ